jgi:lysozyme family protein
MKSSLKSRSLSDLVSERLFFIRSALALREEVRSVLAWALVPFDYRNIMEKETMDAPSNFNRAIQFTLDREGQEFVNYPLDKGGPTKFGVTLKTLKAFTQSNLVDEEDIKNLTKETAIKIYAALFWNVAKLERVKDPNTALILLDFSVLSGPQDSIRLLQQVLNENFQENLKIDGIFGNSTYAALCTAREDRLNRKLIQAIQIHFVRVCESDPLQLIFLEGWLKRSFLLSEVTA